MPPMRDEKNGVPCERFEETIYRVMNGTEDNSCKRSIDVVK